MAEFGLELRHADMERNRNGSDTPVTPLPNLGEGGPVYSEEDDSQSPAIPLPNPGEGGAVYPGDDSQVPVVPLPNPGEGGAVYPGGVIQPIQPLPTVTYAAVRFLNAAYGYPAFRV